MNYDVESLQNQESEYFGVETIDINKRLKNKKYKENVLKGFMIMTG